MLVSAEASVESAIDLMRSANVRRPPVVDGGRAIGIVSLPDLAGVGEPRPVLVGLGGALEREVAGPRPGEGSGVLAAVDRS